LLHGQALAGQCRRRGEDEENGRDKEAGICDESGLSRGGSTRQVRKYRLKSPDRAAGMRRGLSSRRSLALLLSPDRRRAGGGQGMFFNELVAAYDQSRRERNIFHDLMGWRVREVLLVASLYDSFVVESDGVLTEQIYGEYFKLNLNTVPRITSAYSDEAALDLFYEGRFDLVILMAGIDFDKPLAFSSW
jgi:hypothetical protein